MNFYMIIEKIKEYLKARWIAFISFFESPSQKLKRIISDLKNEHTLAMNGLGDIKVLIIDTKREIEKNKQIAKDYEGNAIELYKKVKTGEITEQEADLNVREILEKRNKIITDLSSLTKELIDIKSTEKITENKVEKIKDVIDDLEKNLKTLESRRKIASSTKNINMQIASMQTQTLLEQINRETQNEEALAIAYQELNSLEDNIDKEIEKALNGDKLDTTSTMLELKSKLLE